LQTLNSVESITINGRRYHLIQKNLGKKERWKTEVRKDTYLSKTRGLSPLLSDNFIKISAFGVDFLTA
jgi:hypothetical protein